MTASKNVNTALDPKYPLIPLAPSIEAQKLQRFSSEVLWHFCGRGQAPDQRYQTLLSILRTGLRRGSNPGPFIYFKPNLKTQQMDSQPLETYPYCSVADIPLKDLPVHAAQYGQFAVGFHRRSAIEYGFMPVLYVNQMALEFHKFMLLLEQMSVGLKEPSSPLAPLFEELRLLLGSVVQGGLLQVAPADHPAIYKAQLSNFYYEREWRCLRDWNFEGKDVAAVIVPDNLLDEFLQLRSAPDLKLSPRTLVMGYDTIYRL